MKTRRTILLAAALSVSLCAASLLLAPGAARAADPDCNKCHEAMSKGRVLHPALKKGCGACHVDPHVNKDKAVLSLKADEPPLLRLPQPERLPAAVPAQARGHGKVHGVPQPPFDQQL